MLSYLTSWIIHIYEGLYTANSASSALLNYDISFLGILNNDIFNAFVATIMSLGITLMVLYFCGDLADKVTMQNFNMELFFKSLLKLVIAYFLIIHSLDIVEAFVKFGDGVSTMLLETDTGFSFFEDEEHVEKLSKGLSYFNVIDSLGYMLRLLIPSLICWVSNLVVIFISLSRIVEMVIRALFAPFAVADCFQDGARANGIRYLKKFLALCLQYTMIVAICISVSMVMNSINGSGTADNLTKLLKEGASVGGLLKGSYYTKASCEKFLDAILGDGHFVILLGLQLTKIGLLVKSQSLANDVMGV